MILELFQYFLILIVPGLIGALFFSIAAHFRTQIQWTTAFIISFLTFLTIITGLYFLHDVHTVAYLQVEFNCLSFSRNYMLLSTGISIFYGIVFGLLRRIFFFIR